MNNDAALEQYNVQNYRTPDGYTSDMAVFTIVASQKDTYRKKENQLNILLIKRSLKNSEGKPNIEAGKWALPGGFVNENETALEAAIRELQEETNVSNVHLHHFGIYDRPGRDPRGWIISNAHYAIVPESYLLNRKANDDAAEVQLFPIDEVLALPLAFDHKEIIEEAINVVKQDLLNTTIAKEFLPKQFTITELRVLLSLVTDDPAITERAAFARKIKKLPFIRMVEGETSNKYSRKRAQLYEFVDVNINKSMYTHHY